MKVRVKVKKRITLQLSEEELGDTLRYLVQLCDEHRKLPDGVSRDLDQLTSKYNEAYTIAFKASREVR